MKRGRPLTFDQETIAEIRALAASGMRSTEIGKRIGRNWKGVWQLMKRLEIPRQPKNRFPKEAENPSWNGGRYVDKDGYVLIYCPSHPLARGKGYVREHRLVMEKQIGRYLSESEVVHHKDGNKQNNEIANLQLFAKNSEHLKHELTGRVPKWSEEGKARIMAANKRKVEKKKFLLLFDGIQNM